MKWVPVMNCPRGATLLQKHRPPCSVARLTGRVCTFKKLERVVGARWEASLGSGWLLCPESFPEPRAPTSWEHIPSCFRDPAGGRQEGNTSQELPGRCADPAPAQEPRLPFQVCVCLSGNITFSAGQSSPGRTHVADRENPQPVGAGERAWPLGASSGLQKGLLERYLTRIQQ